MPVKKTRSMTQGTFLLIGDDYIADFDWQQRMSFFDVHVFGATQEKVEDLLQRISQVEEAVPPPDIILIMTGINNVIDKDYTFVDQVKRVVIRLSNRYPEAEIIVNSLPNIDVDFLVDDAVRRLNEHLNDMTRQTGCCYLDNFDILAKKNASILQKDGVHLTQQAYDKWARSFLEFVAFLLEDD